MRLLFPSCFVVAAGCTWVGPALAQDCNCDHEVTPTVTTLNGTDMGVNPGEVICILGGQREFLRVYDMKGTADAPITIKNCGGQVDINNEDRGYGLTLDGSSHVRITGSGDEAFDYGFRIRASREGPDYSASCIVAAGMSTNYELDHLEAYECGFAGISAKTDPSCENRDLSSFVQRQSRLHHLYLHDTGGEGIYFGSTGFPSRTGNCDGTDVELYPHTHEGVFIHDNIIENTGWDGAQVGVSPRDCYVYRNRISRVGLRMEEYQMQGLQIGGGSRCDVFDNFIAHGPAIGLIVLDAADTNITNNVFYDFLDGIYINDRDSAVAAGARYLVAHNTVVQTEDRGITLFGSLSAGNIVRNNLIAGASQSPLGFGVDGVEEGNLILASADAALFEDLAEENFMLTQDSPAVDAGVATALGEVPVDQRSAPRDSMPDVGAFEYGSDVPLDPVSPPGPGGELGGGSGEDPGPPSPPETEPADDVDDGTNGEGKSTDDGGCSCTMAGKRTTGRGSAGAFLLLLGLLGLKTRRGARSWLLSRYRAFQ